MRLSRRRIARHAAEKLLAGDTAVLSQVAAYLIESRRVNDADLLVRDIETALAEAGVVIADVASAHDLTATLTDAITRYVKQAADAREVHLRTQVDESLIGGIRLRTPDAEYDASVRQQLRKLQAMKV